MKHCKAYLIVIFLFTFCFTFINTSCANAPTTKLAPNLSAEDAKIIGNKVWQNECLGTVSGLTSWNKGENFASLGIGHCIWYPEGKQDIFAESFPNLVRYIDEHNTAVPNWLKGANPWQSREEFFAIN